MVINVSKLDSISRLMEVKQKQKTRFTDLPTLFFSDPLAKTNNLFC